MGLADLRRVSFLSAASDAFAAEFCCSIISISRVDSVAASFLFRVWCGVLAINKGTLGKDCLARANKLKEKLVDTELIFAYAKCERLGELEEFVSGPNIADVESVGDRCYRQGMFLSPRAKASAA